MAVNPFTRRPKVRPVFSRSFVDEDWAFTLTFKKPGPLENSAAWDRGEELNKRYLGDDDSKGMDFLLADGTVVELSPTVIRNACAYETMQPRDAGERYRAEDFIAFQATLSDQCWQEVTDFAREVRKGATDVPPTSGGATVPSSESASDTPNVTPNS
jgi:hypothetical protein